MEERVARRVITLAKAIRARFEAALAAHATSVATYAVLADAIEGSGLSQRELAARIGIEAPTLTRHLDRMEADGLIERQRDAADRRILRIHATPAGLRLYAELVDIANRLEADLLEGLGERDRQVLRRLLDRLHTNMEKLDAPAR